MSGMGGGLGYETASLRILDQNDPARADLVAGTPLIALAVVRTPAAARNDVTGDENGACYEGVDAASGFAVVGRTSVEPVPSADLNH